MKTDFVGQCYHCGKEYKNKIYLKKHQDSCTRTKPVKKHKKKVNKKPQLKMVDNNTPIVIPLEELVKFEQPFSTVENKVRVENVKKVILNNFVSCETLSKAFRVRWTTMKAFLTKNPELQELIDGQEVMVFESAINNVYKAILAGDLSYSWKLLEKIDPRFQDKQTNQTVNIQIVTNNKDIDKI